MKKAKVRPSRIQSKTPAPDGTRRLDAATRFNDAFDLYSAYQAAKSKRKSDSWDMLVAAYDRLPKKDDDGHPIPNFGSLRYKIDLAQTTFVDYAMERERWAFISTDEGELEGNSPLWSEEISAAFHRHCVKKWKDRSMTVMLAVRDMLMFFRGMLMWDSPDPCCVYPRSVSIGSVLPDADAGMFPCEFDILFVEERYSAVEMWRKVRNDEACEKSGWRKPEVMDILKTSCGSLKDQSNDEIFTRFGSRQVPQSERDFQIDVVKAYVVEYPKDDDSEMVVSFYVIPAHHGRKITPQLTEEIARNEAGFLCYKERHYESMENACAILASGIARSFYEGKSYAEQIYLTSNIYDLVMYRVLQGIEDNMRVYVEGQDAESFKKLKKMRHRQYNLLPPGLKISQSAGIKRDVMPAMQVLRAIMSDERSGNSSYQVGATDQRGAAITARQAELDHADSLRVSGAEVKVFNDYFTRVMVEIYRRFVSQKKPEGGDECREWKSFERFKKYLKHKGVPDEAWAFENVTVSSVVSMGAGSPAARLQAARTTLEALSVPSSGPGETRAKRDLIAAVQGIENVPAYLPDDEAMSVPEDSLIGLENDVLSSPTATPRNAPVLPHQAHMRHIASHVEDSKASLDIAGKLFNARQQLPQVDDGIILAQIEDILVGVDHKLAHTQAHIMLAKKSGNKAKVGVIKQAEDQIAQLNAQQDQLINMVSEAKQQRAGLAVQPQSNPDEDHKRTMNQLIEEHEARMLALDYQKAQMKGEQLRENSQRNTEHKQALEDIKTAAEIRRENDKAAADSLIKARTAKSDEQTSKSKGGKK